VDAVGDEEIVIAPTRIFAGVISPVHDDRLGSATSRVRILDFRISIW
jgi:hypothetical protein